MQLFESNAYKHSSYSNVVILIYYRDLKRTGEEHSESSPELTTE